MVQGDPGSVQALNADRALHALRLGARPRPPPPLSRRREHCIALATWSTSSTSEGPVQHLVTLANTNTEQLGHSGAFQAAREEEKMAMMKDMKKSTE